MTMLNVNRRQLMRLAGSATAAALLPRLAFAELATEKPLHGLSSFGDLKYPADFVQFDYANPDAPKGGTFRLAPSNWILNQNTQTFNTLNTFTLQGDAPPRMELTYDSLMVSALDEADSVYGLIAETVTLSKDRRSFDFKLREAARFHDGSPLTADDVVFSYLTLKEKGHPTLRQALARLSKIEKLAKHRVRLQFAEGQGPEAILDAVTLPILSAKWFEGRDFTAASEQAPLGSGPYKVGAVSKGSSIEYDRVADYWAKDLPVQRGLNHFNRIRIEFFRDRQPEFEAFKKGDIDWRMESVSKNWATAYDFPAIKHKKILKREFSREKRPLMQAWALNQRRERFRDPRVREAISLCFDFEWTNQNLFYGLYQRSQSCFNGSEFEARDLPTADELKVIDRYRGKLPDAIVGSAVTMPQSDGTGRDRAQYSRAIKLLDEAGYKRHNGQILDKNGEKFSLEILFESDSFNRILQPYVQKLRAIGLDATLRMVDPTQFQARMRDFDFDMVGRALQLSATPTVQSLQGLFGSKSANEVGSYNLTGTADPLIDALIEDIGSVKSRNELVALLRVLDRYLRLRRDWIPNWTAANQLVAYWDRFGFKEPKPDYGFPVEVLWWFDEQKANAIEKPKADI